MRPFSNPHFLAIYSGLLTVAFFLTVSLGLARGDFTLHRVSASEQRDSRHLDFDELTVHRINIVEPDGTPRLIISDKAEFAGEFHALGFAPAQRGGRLPQAQIAEADVG